MNGYFLSWAYYLNIADYPGVKNFPVLSENSLPTNKIF